MKTTTEMQGKDKKKIAVRRTEDIRLTSAPCKDNHYVAFI